jgi:hypothetical protein
MKLSPEQESRIEADIQQSSLRSKPLEDDLLDHFCCAVEHEMEKGKSFEEAYAEAHRHIAPNGLAEIEKETVFLLNSTKFQNMKKVLIVSTLVFAMTLSMGAMFKLMYWPGANLMSGAGIFGLGFISLPLLLWFQFRNKAQKHLNERLRNMLGAASGLLFALSVVFKILHLMGADILLILSFVLFTFGFLPFAFFKIYKKTAG